MVSDELSDHEHEWVLHQEDLAPQRDRRTDVCAVASCPAVRYRVTPKTEGFARPYGIPVGTEHVREDVLRGKALEAKVAHYG